MPFVADASEPDGDNANARPIVPVAQTVSASGHVVINELHLGPLDTMELSNTTPSPVDLTGWQLEVFANGITQDPTRVYTFPPFTLDGGEVLPGFTVPVSYLFG